MGTYAKEAFDVLKSIEDNKGSWTGEASKAFANKLGELPDYLDDAHQSLTEAGKALTTWSDHLAAHQAKAHDLEAQAKQAQADFETKNTAAGRARVTAMGSSNDEQLHNDAMAKIRVANTAWDKLEDIRAQAKALMDTWEADGNACAEALNDAAEKAPNKSFFESFGEMFDDLGKWFKDHLGDIAGIISAVAGALAFIPVLAPIAGPVALIAGGVALAAHAGDMTVNDKWGDPNAWISVAGDVLGLIPGGKLVAEGFKAGGEAASGATKLVDIGRATIEGGKVIADGARAVPDAAKVFVWVADRAVGSGSVVADLTAKSLQAGSNVVLQIPGAVGLFDNSGATTTSKNVAGGAAALLNSIQWKSL